MTRRLKSRNTDHGTVIGSPVVPRVVAPVSGNSAMQAADAIVTAIAVTDRTTSPEVAGRVIVAQTFPRAAETEITAAARKCVAGKRGATENKGGCKSNDGLANH